MLLALPNAVVWAAPRTALMYYDYGGTNKSYQQDLTTGSRTRTLDFGVTRIHWDPHGRYAVGAVSRWDEAYQWLNVRVYDSWTGQTRIIRDEQGTEFADQSGEVSFGGWSADGRRFSLVLTSWDSGNSSSRVYIFDSASAQAVRSVSCLQGSGAAISPDGQSALYSFGGQNGNSIWKFDASSDQIWLTADALQIEDLEGWVTPYWPSNGGEVFVNVEEFYSARHVHVMGVNLKTKAVREIPSEAGLIRDVTPNGRYVLVESQPWDQVVGWTELNRIDTLTGALITAAPLSFTKTGAIGAGEISDDGGQVLIEKVFSEQSIRPEIWSAAYNGAGMRRVAYGKSAAFVTDSFRPRPYGWAVENGSDTDQSDDWAVCGRGCSVRVRSAG